MMDEKQIESLKRRYGSRIADAPKRRRGPERMAVMKGGKPKAGGQTMLRLLSYLKRDRMAMTVAFFCVILGTVTNLAGAYMLRPIINRVAAMFQMLQKRFQLIPAQFILDIRRHKTLRFPTGHRRHLLFQSVIPYELSFTHDAFINPFEPNHTLF